MGRFEIEREREYRRYTMKMNRPFTILFGVTAAFSMVTNACAAQRLQNVVQRVVPEALTPTNSAGTFRIAGIAVDADGKPVAGAVVECYRSGSGGWMPVPADL